MREEGGETREDSGERNEERGETLCRLIRYQNRERPALPGKLVLGDACETQAPCSQLDFVCGRFRTPPIPFWFRPHIIPFPHPIPAEEKRGAPCGVVARLSLRRRFRATRAGVLIAVGGGRCGDFG